MTRRCAHSKVSRLVEFGHMVMGPTCGLILVDLGADVVKVEPAPDGDKTRLDRTEKN